MSGPDSFDDFRPPASGQIPFRHVDRQELPTGDFEMATGVVIGASVLEHPVIGIHPAIVLRVFVADGQVHSMIYAGSDAELDGLVENTMKAVQAAKAARDERRRAAS